MRRLKFYIDSPSRVLFFFFLERFDINLTKSHSETSFFMLRFLQESKGPWPFIRSSIVVYFTMLLIMKMNYINLRVVLIYAVTPCMF